MGLFQRTTERVAQAEQAWDDLEDPDAQALKDLQALKEQAVVSQQHPLLLALHIEISPWLWGRSIALYREVPCVMACWSAQKSAACVASA